MANQDKAVEIFKSWDANGDGTISEDELKTALLKIGMSEKQIATAFEEADTNKDGVVSYEEFLAWVYTDPCEAIKKLISGSKGLKSQATLDALEEAGKMVSKIPKKHLHEVKCFATPPPLVQKTLSAAGLLLGAPNHDNWKGIQKMISNEKQFLNQILEFDPSSVTGDTVQKLNQYTSDEAFTPEVVKKCSTACVGIMMWVLAVKAFAEEQ